MTIQDVLDELQRRLDEPEENPDDWDFGWYAATLDILNFIYGRTEQEAKQQ